VEPFPEPIAFSQISQSPIERLLPPAHTRLDLVKLCSGRGEGTSVEQLTDLAPGDAGPFVPRVDLQPDTIASLDVDPFAVTGLEPVGPLDRDDPRGKRDTRQRHRCGHRRCRARHIKHEFPGLHIPRPHHLGQCSRENLVAHGEPMRVLGEDPVPATGHLKDLWLDGCFDQRFRRGSEEETEILGLQAIDGIDGGTGLLPDGDQQRLDRTICTHERRTIAPRLLGHQGDSMHCSVMIAPSPLV
jgi:hypothetical protein